MLELLDEVSLRVDLVKHGFKMGTRGTIVEVLAPGVFMVEFDGDTEMILPSVREEDLTLEWKNPKMRNSVMV